jgi:hypothetical protein
MQEPDLISRLLDGVRPIDTGGYPWTQCVTAIAVLSERERDVTVLARLRPHASTIAIAACVLLAVGHAWALAWLSDDAFISFRYARNLVEGHGLVFNPGERVEGYTNPLWTVFLALGLRLGAPAEAWSTVWGIACYGVSIALLGVMHKRACAALGAPDWLAAVPFGAMYGAANVEWATFATGGLETSLFTMLVTLGLVLVVDEKAHDTKSRALGAGAVLALAALTRPDGALFVALGLGYVAVRRGWRDAILFSVAFAALWGPFTAWRVSYYGSFFPNTYYAKSANLAWWSQGLFYVGLYFQRHWLLALAPLVVAVFGRRVRPVAPLALVSLAFGLAYTTYVARVGGASMYARLVVPATPMFLVLLDVGATLIARLAPRASVAIAALCVAAPIGTPLPLAGDSTDRDIGDERSHYTTERWARTRARASAIAPFFEGLPAVVAIYGDEVGLAYYARLPNAIEAHTGLTDAYVAHLPLARRGRVGHEKLAPLDYLVEKRGALLTFSKVPTLLLDLDAYVPVVHADLAGVRARILRWDPALIAELRARGATVDDFPAQLDALIAKLPSLTDDEVSRELLRCRRFYFDHVSDPAREAAFTTRLASRERVDHE